MRRWTKAAGIAALGVVTLGATPKTESATVTMGKGYDKGLGFGAATMQDYYLLPHGETCQGKKRLAGFDMLKGKPTTRPVPAGAPVNFYAVVVRSEAFQRGVCRNNVRFTTMPGHNYSMLRRSAVWESCKIEVIDLATNQAPVDLMQDNSLKCTS